MRLASCFTDGEVIGFDSRGIERRVAVVEAEIEARLLERQVVLVYSQIVVLVLEIVIDVVERRLQTADLLVRLFQTPDQQAFHPADNLALFLQLALDVV